MSDTEKVQARHDAMALPNIMSMSEKERTDYQTAKDVRHMEAGAMARSNRLQAQKRQSKMKK
jgi:hypothetical protein